MCGIIGYTGKENAIPRLLHGLKALEYRGYDSAGIAFFNKADLKFIKEKGRISELENKVESFGKIDTHCGIGHTRWATHGEPSAKNAHPHGTDNVLLVHNGIIENYDEIKTFLRNTGYEFTSATDTEAAAKLIDFYFRHTKDPLKSISDALEVIEGAYAMCAIFKGFDGEIYAFRKDNPLTVCPSREGNFITSDVSAVLGYTDKYYEIAEGEIARVTGDSIIFTSGGKEIKDKMPQRADWSALKTDRDGFEHFMLKEIFEEPESVEKTLASAVSEGKISLGSLSDEIIRNCAKIHIVACGTAYHAGLIGKAVIENMARVGVNVYYASEFRYINPVLNENELVIAISQSGETADTLGALRLAKLKGMHTFAIVNTEGSALAREAHSVFITKAGQEVSVASTKAYHVQLAALYLVALKLASVRLTLPSDEISRLTYELISKVPDKIREAIEHREQCEYVAKKYVDGKNMFFIGRGMDKAQCEEAALKAKEISYIHCEAYAAGELKHGTISLIEEGTPVVAIITSTLTADKMVNNIQEVKARGARVILFVTQGIDIPRGIANDIVYLPRTEEIFMPFICGTATQLMAYYMAVQLGNDVDKPRNLAKSVTVE